MEPSAILMHSNVILGFTDRGASLSLSMGRLGRLGWPTKKDISQLGLPVLTKILKNAQNLPKVKKNNWYKLVVL